MSNVIDRETRRNVWGPFDLVQPPRQEIGLTDFLVCSHCKKHDRWRLGVQQVTGIPFVICKCGMGKIVRGEA